MKSRAVLSPYSKIPRTSSGTFKKGYYIKKEDHPLWKGGLPVCKSCPTKLSIRNGKTGYCQKCFLARRVGEKSFRWKGGIKNNNGYIMIYSPLHPNKDQQGYVRQHRLVMESYIGRYLFVYEVVHHLNGNKSDNRIENLQLLKVGEHEKIHHYQRVRNELGQYQ